MPEERRNSNGIVIVAILIVGASVGLPGAVADSTNDPTAIDSCTTVSEPGEYVLTEDIENDTADACIEIRSSDVAFDGGDHVIDGGDSAADEGTAVVSSDRSNVTVRNVSVSGWEKGVAYRNVENGTVADVTASNNSVGVLLFNASAATVENTNATGNSGSGIEIRRSTDATVANATSNGNNIGVALVASNDSRAGDVSTARNAKWSYYTTNASTNNSIENLTIDGTDAVSFTGTDVALAPVTAPPEPPNGTVAIGPFVRAIGTTDASWAFLNVSYAASDPANVDEETLGMWTYDGNWTETDGETGVNAERNYVYANVSDSGVFVPLSENRTAEAVFREPIRIESVRVDGEPVTIDPPSDADGDGLYEDVDGDGDVDNRDAAALGAIVADHQYGNLRLSDDQVAALDFDGDGRLGVRDVTEFRRSEAP